MIENYLKIIICKTKANHVFWHEINITHLFLLFFWKELNFIFNFGNKREIEDMKIVTTT